MYDPEPLTVFLPDGLQTVEKMHWFQNGSVTRVVVPVSVEKIEDHAFSDCPMLRAVEFAQGSVLRTIGIGAFQHSGLEMFTAPPTLQHIGSLAFYGCTQLKYVSLNPTVRIGWLCFCGTGVKINVALPMSFAALGIGQNPTKLLVLPDGIEVVSKELF